MEAMNQFFKQHKSPSLGTAPLDSFFGSHTVVEETSLKKVRFLKALLERLVCHVRAVVLLPTRDLALQALWYCSSQRYTVMWRPLLLWVGPGKPTFKRPFCTCPLKMMEFLVTTLAVHFCIPEVCITWYFLGKFSMPSKQGSRCRIRTKNHQKSV